MAQPNIPFTTAPETTPPTPIEIMAMRPAKAAYERTLPEIHAVSDDDLVPVNIDILHAVTTVMGVVPEIRALRSQIEAEWRSFDFAQFDNLEQYALALHHAHSLHRSSVSKESIASLGEELETLRDQLLANATSLARLGLLDGERLKAVKKVNGYRALASDVETLCTVFEDGWVRVEGKTPFTPQDFVRIGMLSAKLLNAVGLRDQAPVLAGEAALIRQRAFTLFVRAYDQARRAVHYLRAHEGDGERIAPSLYAGRGGRRRYEQGLEPPPPVAPAISAAATPAGGARAAAAPNEPPAPIVIENTANLPIDDPFTS